MFTKPYLKQPKTNLKSSTKSSNEHFVKSIKSSGIQSPSGIFSFWWKKFNRLRSLLCIGLMDSYYKWWCVGGQQAKHTLAHNPCEVNILQSIQKFIINLQHKKRSIVLRGEPSINQYLLKNIVNMISRIFHVESPFSAENISESQFISKKAFFCARRCRIPMPLR